MELGSREPLLDCEVEIASSLANVLRHAPAFFAKYPDVVLGSSVPLLGCEAEEASSFAIVLRQPAPAFYVANREVVLRFGEALISCQAEEASSFAIVLWHAFALCVALCQAVLRLSVALLGS